MHNYVLWLTYYVLTFCLKWQHLIRTCRSLHTLNFILLSSPKIHLLSSLPGRRLIFFGTHHSPCSYPIPLSLLFPSPSRFAFIFNFLWWRSHLFLMLIVLPYPNLPLVSSQHNLPVFRIVPKFQHPSRITLTIRGTPNLWKFVELWNVNLFVSQLRFNSLVFHLISIVYWPEQPPWSTRFARIGWWNKINIVEIRPWPRKGLLRGLREWNQMEDQIIMIYFSHHRIFCLADWFEHIS